MSKYQVFFTTQVEVEVEADSEKEAEEKAFDLIDTGDQCVTDVDIYLIDEEEDEN